MNKRLIETLGLILFIYLEMEEIMGIDFLIKIMLIGLSLIVHSLGHRLAGIVTEIDDTIISDDSVWFGEKYENIKGYSFIKKIIYSLGGVFGNSIIIVSALNFDNYYSKYLIAINLGIIIFNLLPISFLDGGVIIKSVLDNFLSDCKTKKSTKFLSNLFLVFLYCIAFIQMILVSYNFSLLIICFIVSKYLKENEEVTLKNREYRYQNKCNICITEIYKNW